jgi:type I restriction enzyme S subunit
VNRGWQIKNLGEVCQVVGGGTPSKAKPEYYSGNIPWATVRDMRSEVIYETECRITNEAVKNSATNIIRNGNVVIATRVGLGKVCLVGQDTAINQDLRGVVPNDPKVLSVRFLFWWLKSIADLIVAEGTGATVQGVKLPFVKSLQVPLPPVSEQNRIVGILDEAFDGIATAKANAEKNLQNARALFESHLQSVFSRRGPGWVETLLDDVCRQITDGKHGDCKAEDGSGFYFLSAKDVKGGTLNYEGARQITKSDFEETHRRTDLEPGDILITNSGTIGRMAVAPADKKTTRTTFQKSVAILKPMKERIDSKFAFYCLSSGLIRFVNLSAGTAQKNLLLRDLRSYRFALPKSLEQQRVVANELESLSEETQRLESIYQQKLAALDALKKSLLHQAFSGQL